MTAIAAASVPESPTAAVLATTLRADASVLHALGEREAALQMVSERSTSWPRRIPRPPPPRFPFVLKGLRRALRRPEPARAEGRRPH